MRRRHVHGQRLGGPSRQDAPLWFFWTLQQLEREVGGKQIWKAYGPAMKDILESYRRGVGGRVARMTTDWCGPLRTTSR